MYQYFKRQLKSPTCFGSSGIHPQGVLKVLHCASTRHTHTPHVQISRCQTPTTHTKHHK